MHMKSWKIILSTIVVILIPIIINLLISFISWGSGSNDGWLGFWGGYLGALISILGIYVQVTKSIEESKKNRDASEKENKENINLLKEQAKRDKEKIKSQQEELTEQKIKDQVQALQSVRPFIRVDFCKTNLKICFEGEIKNIWFKYGDIYLPAALFENRDSEEKLAHKQLGSLCTSPLVVTYTNKVIPFIIKIGLLLNKRDRDYRFILKIKTMHNEEVFIYHTPGNPDVYCYEITENDNKLMGSDGYIGIQNSIEENDDIFGKYLHSPSWLKAVKELDEEYRKHEFIEK